MPFHRKLAQFIELNLRYMFVIVLKENKYSILFYIKLTLHKLCLTPPPLPAAGKIPVSAP